MLEHPFYTEKRGWLSAGELWAGAQARQADDHYRVVKVGGFEQRP